MGFGSKKMWGGIAKIALKVAPVPRLVSEGAELAVGELLLKDDEEKERYRGWYEAAKTLRDSDLSNREKKRRLLSRIETDMTTDAGGKKPGETDLMYNFYTVVKDVKGDFEVDDAEDAGEKEQ